MYNFLLKLCYYIISFFAVMIVLTMHEFAHAMTAYKNGDLTPKLQGRCSLNPAVHFDPWGLVMMVLCGFGWAKPVPINPYNFRNYRKGLIWTSLAGILTNICFAFLICPFYLLSINLVTQGYTGLFVYQFASKLFYLSVGFFVFNLIPLPPLDGWQFLSTVKKNHGRVMYWIRYNGQKILFALLVWSFICDTFSLPFYLDIFGMFYNYVVIYTAKPIVLFWELIIGLF